MDIMEINNTISAWYMNTRLKYFQQIMLSTFGPESWALWAFVSTFLHTRRLIVVIPNDRILRGTLLLSFVHKRTHICIHNKNGTYNICQ